MLQANQIFCFNIIISLLANEQEFQLIKQYQFHINEEKEGGESQEKEEAVQSSVKPVKALSIDFSINSQYIQVSTTLYDVLYFNLSNGLRLTLDQSKDISWSSWTNRIGWSVQGITSNQFDNNIADDDDNFIPTAAELFDFDDQICQIQRNHGDKKLIIIGDSLGRLKLFTYPCISSNNIGKIFYGHATAIENIQFTKNDQYVFTSSKGNDAIRGTMFQWLLVSSTQAKMYQQHQKLRKENQHLLAVLHQKSSLHQKKWKIK